MARASATKKKTNDDRPILTSKTVAFVVLTLAVMGLVSARLGIGPRDEAAEAARAAAASSGAEVARLTQAPPVLGQAVELADIDGWINSRATGLGTYSGQVRIVQFWTFG
ncbi:MAG: hypothetical protein OER95_05415, partial [Acidimicrobiia bacterium]|nr:hypothetical protein [Acidimicrobiia bacterium]